MRIDHDEERRLILAAMDRLIAGHPLVATSASLTVVNLALEASVPRGALTHRHQDLRDMFYSKVRALGMELPEISGLKGELARLRRQYQASVTENEALRAEIALWSRLARALAVENEELRKAAGKPPLRLV